MNVAEHNRVILRSVTTAILGIAAAYVVYLVRDVLLTLYFSGLLAVGLSPAVRILEHSRLVNGKRRKIPRWMALLALYLAFLLVVAIILAVVVPPLVEQIQQLVAALPTYADNAQKALIARGLIKKGSSWTDMVMNMQVPQIALNGIYNVVQMTVGALGQALTVLLLPFYLLLESNSLQAWMLRLVKRENQARAGRVMSSVTTKVGAWLSGQLLLAAVIGVTATIGFRIIGVPYYSVMGLLAALGEMVPVIGPLLAAVPAVLLGWTVSPATAVYVVAYSAVQQFIEGNVLVPRIMERQVGVSPVTIMVALLIGSSLLGLVGAVLSVPTAAIIQVIIREYYESKDRREE